MGSVGPHSSSLASSWRCHLLLAASPEPGVPAAARFAAEAGPLLATGVVGASTSDDGTPRAARSARAARAAAMRGARLLFGGDAGATPEPLSSQLYLLQSQGVSKSLSIGVRCMNRILLGSTRYPGYRGSQMTSHTSTIGHGRRERGGGRWKQHGAPLDVFKISVSE